jgi:histidinol-phosphate phosphatase family protein
MMDLSHVTAAVLAGGLGTRLRSVVSDRPKGLAQICGRPFLAFLLDQLGSAGVRTAVLCTGYLGEQVKEAFGGEYHGLRLTYSQEQSPLGTGGALRLAAPMLASDPVLVLNGDSYAEAALSELLDWHHEHRAEATLLLAHAADTRRYGRVNVDSNGTILEFVEKGRLGGPGWVNAGVYLLGHRFLETIQTTGPVSLEREVFPAWIGRGLFGCMGNGQFLDIGTPESYASAEAYFGAMQGGRRMVRRPFVVLDRDGTIIVERQYLSDPDQVELIPGVVDGLRRLRDLNVGLAVVTNQSAIGRGFFDRERVEQIHRRMEAMLAAEGIRLDGIYVCPHTPDDNCSCRKPLPGLIRQASWDLGFDAQDCFVIGDKDCDIELGRRSGATTLLVRTGYGAQLADTGTVSADYVVNDVAEAAQVIEGLLKIRGGEHTL